MTPDEIIKSVRQLVSLPEAVMRASELLDDPDASIEEIGEVISHDPALSAQLLKMVNSAFYNFPKQIDTISRAITLIGLVELRSLIVASSSARCFGSLSSDLIDIDVFWQRSVFCGLVAKKLVQLCNHGSAETMFLSGLLHDVGRLLLYTARPEQAGQILASAEQSGELLTRIEEKQLGFTSQELGATLLASWQLPAKLWEPIRYQNLPDQASDFSREAQILQLAVTITSSVDPEIKTGEPLAIDDALLEKFPGCQLDSEQVATVIAETNAESFEVLAIINPSATVIY